MIAMAIASGGCGYVIDHLANTRSTSVEGDAGTLVATIPSPTPLSTTDSSSPFPPDPCQRLAPLSDSVRTTSSGGMNRSFRVVPTAAVSSAPSDLALPLVIALSDTGSAQQFRTETKLVEAAGNAPMIFAFPKRKAQDGTAAPAAARTTT